MIKKLCRTAAVVLFLVILYAAASAELVAPAGVRWLENSTATAVWLPSEGANYYTVDLIVSLNNDLIGKSQTGTADTAIDVQQEIHDIVEAAGRADEPHVMVIFAVTAKYITGEQELSSERSAYSDELQYYLHDEPFIVPAPPTDLMLDTDLNLSYNDASGWASGDIFYYYFHITDGSGSEYSVEDCYPSALSNLAYMLDNICIGYDLVMKPITVRVAVSCEYRLPDKTDMSLFTSYLSDLSEYSNTVDYCCKAQAEERKAPDTPTDLYLSSSLKLTFDPGPDGFIANHYYYSLKFVTEDKQEYYAEDNYPSPIEDLTASISGAYIHGGLAGQKTMVSVAVWCERFYQNGMDPSRYESYSSDMSEYSNAVEYYEEAEESAFPVAPYGLRLNDNLVLTCYFDVSGSGDSLVYGIMLETGDGQVYYGEDSASSPITDFTDIIDHVYTENGLLGRTVYVSIAVTCEYRTQAGMDPSVFDIYSVSSDYSNKVEYGRMQVKELTLSPAAPVLYSRNALALGKTILPENAYYRDIIWSSDNTAVLTVDSTGNLHGRSAGTATVTAKIDRVSDSVVVSVYNISSNVDETSGESEVTGTAGSIIDGIGNDEDIDLSNTDIDKEDVEKLQEQIREGIEREDEFCADVIVNRYEWDSVLALDENNKQLILDMLQDGGFSQVFELNAEVYHQDKSGNKYHIANILGFGVPVECVWDGSDWVEVAPDPNNLLMVRVRGGLLETFPVTCNPDGTISVTFDSLSEPILVADGNNLFGDDAFTMPAALTEISEDAFDGDNMITVIDAGSCTSIGSRAFRNCTGLTRICLPRDCTIDIRAFDGCGTVYVYAPTGGSTEAFCRSNSCLIFVPFDR